MRDEPKKRTRPMVVDWKGDKRRGTARAPTPDFCPDVRRSGGDDVLRVAQSGAARAVIDAHRAVSRLRST
jgi:hypothetical protein